MRLRKNVFWFCLLITLTLIITTVKVNVARAHSTRVFVDYHGSSNIFGTGMVPGTRFSINITVDYVEEVWGFQVEMKFNPEVLQGVSVESGGFLERFGKVIEMRGEGFDNKMGVLWLYGLAFMSVETTATGGGVFVVITFEVVEIGRSPIDFGPMTMVRNNSRPPGYWLGPDWEKNPLFCAVNPDAFTNGEFDNRPPVCLIPDKVKGVPLGKNFTINVNAINATDLYAYSFYINWNSSILNVVQVTEGDFMKGQPEGTDFYYTINNTAGYLYVNSTTKGAHAGVSGSGTLASVTFTVKGTGSSYIYLWESTTFLLDSEKTKISVRTVHSKYEKVHDIAITSIVASPEKVKAGSGEVVFFNVTLSNVGGFNETNINVTVYYEENEIGTQTAESIEMGFDKTLAYTWNTTGVGLGKYVIKAVASPVVNETSTDDNTLTYGLYTIWAHDIAIISVTTPVTRVYLGTSIPVTVEVRNEGTEIENFNVTAYCNETAIETKMVTDLDFGESREQEFIWDTTYVELGNYTISANATKVEGEEDIDDNFSIQSSLVMVIPLEEQSFTAELLILAMILVVTIGAAILFYWRRRRPSRVEEELLRL